jgi:elongation factor P
MEICDLKKGQPVNWKHGVWAAVDITFVNPGKGSAFYKVKLKNIDTGQLVENTFKSGEVLDEAQVQYKKCQYLYSDGSRYHFMDQESFEQFEMDGDTLGSTVDFLRDGEEVKVVVVNGKNVAVQLATKLVFEVTDAPPGVKGDSATGKTMPAIIETGATVQVPLFVKTGDKIRVNTETGEYVERVQ